MSLPRGNASEDALLFETRDDRPVKAIKALNLARADPSKIRDHAIVWRARIDKLRARHPGGTIVCVSHADTIKAAVAHALGTHIDLFQRIVISPASVSALTWHAGGPVVLAVNSTGRPLTELRPA